MNKDKIYLFDTTLRDGAQTEGVDFSLEDKNKIANVLSDIGIDYIEGGWPGANPIDTKFFSKPPKTKKSIFNPETKTNEILTPMSKGGYFKIGEEPVKVMSEAPKQPTMPSQNTDQIPLDLAAQEVSAYAKR